MAMPFHNAVISTAGLRLINKAQAGETGIEFTRIAIGNGQYEEAEKSMDSMRELSELKSFRNSYGISSSYIASENSIRLAALISNYDAGTQETLVEEDYFINEIGVYAKEKGRPDDEEILYSIAVTAGEKGDYMPAFTGSNPVEIMQEYYVTVHDSDMVTISINPGTPALAADLQKMQESKVDKVNGKGLSTNDFTNEEKEKLKNIDENANNYTHPASAGSKHIPSGGSEGQVLKNNGKSGEAEWEDLADTYDKEYIDTNFAPGGTLTHIFTNKGWYRIAKIQGGASNSCELSIKRDFNSVQPECHKVQLLSQHLKSKIVDIHSSCQALQIITSVRHTVDGNDMSAYIEIYYSQDLRNAVNFTLMDNYNSGLRSKLMKPELTSETVSGVDVRSKLDLPANFDISYLYSKMNLGKEGYNYQYNCILIDNVDLNDISESGLYFCSNPVNAPETYDGNKNGFMIAITYAGTIRGMQLYMPLLKDAVYKRQNTGVLWNDWKEIKAGSAESAAVADAARKLWFEDVRTALNPKDFAARRLSACFTTGSALGLPVTGNSFMDLLVLNGYGDKTGGNVNAIAIEKKQEPAIYHLFGEYGSEKWNGRKRLAYADDVAASATKAAQDADGNVITDTYAKKSIYGDDVVSKGRKSGTGVGNKSFAFGTDVEASGYNSHAEGLQTKAIAGSAHAEGAGTTASNYSSHACGKFNKEMQAGGEYNNQIGDVFVIGNGTADGIVENKLSNALRVTCLGDVMGTKAFQSSGADYAEFIKPWADGNEENEDRIGYFATVKNGFLYKANAGDYIAGITSGNPSVVGNADEDYYWRYERDEFNRILMEDVPELVQVIDENGDPVFDEETQEPVMKETGKIIKNARMKWSEDYDPSLQDSYIERKDRKEWDYVGMLGVLPVRDDGTCVPGQFCKCGSGGIATYAEKRDFDTFMVMDRISENVVSVILK